MDHHCSILQACSLIIFLSDFCCRASVTVSTKNGKFIGQKVNFQDYELNQFLGIPYAEPPLGELRFLKTKEFNGSPDQVFQATTPRPACPQFTKNPFPWYDNSTYKSEDCLYLNIWAPSDACANEKKAVFYWIYSGGFRYGSINLEVYNGIALAALGDMVVVTVNYRVGTLGFLTSGTEEAPGNAGFWDILEGLKWVNKHIDAFGGDTSRITIAGQSAGSIAVGLLSATPLAKGLYKRAIAESGAPTYLLAKNNTQNVANSQKVAKRVGCATDNFTIHDHPEPVLRCLRSLHASTIAVAESSINRHSSMLYFTQYGDALFPYSPRKAIKYGDFRCTDLLTGDVESEGTIQLTSGNPEFFGFYGKKSPHVNKSTGREMIQESFKTYPNTAAIINHYLPGKVPENSYYFVRQQVASSKGDSSLVCPTVYYAELCSQQGNHVYYYYWVHRPSNSPFAKWMGATHFSEVQFVFGQPLLHPKRYKKSEVELSRRLIEMWSSFVKTGNPGESWPLFSREKHNYKPLGSPAINETSFEQHLKNCEFFRSTFESQ